MHPGAAVRFSARSTLHKSLRPSARGAQSRFRWELLLFACRSPRFHRSWLLPSFFLPSWAPDAASAAWPSIQASWSRCRNILWGACRILSILQARHCRWSWDWPLARFRNTTSSPDSRLSAWSMRSLLRFPVGPRRRRCRFRRPAWEIENPNARMERLGCLIPLLHSDFYILHSSLNFLLFFFFRFAGEIMSFSLKDRVAVVFGVANKRSIAWSIAQGLHEAGAKVVITYQNERLEMEAKDLILSLPGAEGFMCDVSNDEAIEKL